MTAKREGSKDACGKGGGQFKLNLNAIDDLRRLVFLR